MTTSIRQQRSSCFIKRVHLVRLEVGNDLRKLRDQILHKGPRFGGLLRDKLSFTFLGDLQKRVARHILDAWMQLVHELKQLVDDRLQELPMST